MECRTDIRKKNKYQIKLWGLFLGNAALFVLGCAAMVNHWVPDSVRGLVALALVALVVGLFPSFLWLIQGLAISGTQRVFLTDGTLLVVTRDGDNGEGGAIHRFYKIWKIWDYQVKEDRINITAFVWYAEKRMSKEALPVADGQLGDLTDIFAKAQRCRRDFSIRRTLEREDEILAMLQKRKEEGAML